MSSRIHRKNIIYYEDDGCWQYCSKCYHTKNYDKTSTSKHERKQIASSSKNPPSRTIDMNKYSTYISPQTGIRLILDTDGEKLYP